MDIYEEITLQECPNCQGAGLLEEEGGWAWYVNCVDCGAHTADIEYKTEAERFVAARKAADLWNMGKVVSHNPGE